MDPDLHPTATPVIGGWATYSCIVNCCTWTLFQVFQVACQTGGPLAWSSPSIRA